MYRPAPPELDDEDLPAAKVVTYHNSSADSYEEVVKQGFLMKDMAKMIVSFGGVDVRIELVLDQYTQVGSVIPIAAETKVTAVMDCLSPKGFVGPILRPMTFADLQGREGGEGAVKQKIKKLVGIMVDVYVKFEGGLGLNRF